MKEAATQWMCVMVEMLQNSVKADELCGVRSDRVFDVSMRLFKFVVIPFDHKAKLK